MLFDLRGQVALITGASKGIGKAIAQQMALHGAKVVVSSRKLDVCEQVTEEINALCKDNNSGGEAIALACNIGYKDQLENLVAKTKQAFGRIDILVCNAALNPFYGSMQDIPDSAFEKIMSANVLSNHWLAQMVIPDMREQKSGVILIVSSVGGLIGSSTIGTYNISKAADMALVRNIALEFGPDNIRANAIAPGLIRTDFARALWENPKTYAAVTAKYPLRRIGEPDEIAGTAVYLASKAGSFVTGQTLVVDGGGTIAGG